ncbi:MAG: ATP-binding protein, partial [Rhizobacter sp.]
DLVRREVARHEINPTFTTVESADAFHEAMTTTHFDAILSDNRVPGIDGIQALQIAREQRPGIPFVFVSGNADPHWAEHCLAEGATDYVAKTQLWRLPSALKRIHVTRETERLAWLTRGRAVLVDAVKALSLARNVETIVDIVRHAARQINQADGATFVLRDGERCHYVDEDAISPLWKGLKFPLETCISGWAMLNRASAVIPDIYVDPRIPHDAYRPTFVKSLVMVPIRGEAPIGAIGNYWATPHAATPDEVELIQALADSTSLAFENLALVQGLEARVQQRTADLEEANRELESFSFSVSHDLRAPRRALQGYGDLLAHSSPPLSGESATFVQHIRSSARRMNQLIEDMLSLSKITRAEVNKRPMSIGKVVKEILTHLQENAPQRQVRVEVDETLVADGDPALLRLALDNLLSNAWKYTGKREDALIQFYAEKQPDGQLLYSIRDNGAGFDMTHAQRLFEPFRRMHSESEFPGTGVGLAIVHRVIRKHGGELSAQAARNQGATFSFTLPPATQPAE